MCEEGRKMFPQFKEKFILLYNAKDEQLLAEYAEKTIDNPLIQRPYLLAVERLEESQKDLSTLIRAYSLLVHEHHISEWLYIIGKGKDEAQLKQLAKTLQVADKVVFFNPPRFHGFRIAKYLCIAPNSRVFPQCLSKRCCSISSLWQPIVQRVHAKS